MSDFAFDRETAVESIGNGVWSAHLIDGYNIADNPNGGYLMATALRAMQADLRSRDATLLQPDPLTFTAHFLRPGVPDLAAEIRTEVAKLGRSISTVRATLRQADKVRLELLAGFGDLASGPDDHEFTVEPPALPPPEDCVDRAELVQGVSLPLLSRVEVRVPKGQVDFGRGRAAKISGWIRFSDGRPPDSLALSLFADAYPPSLFTALGTVGWVPTLEMTVQVRRRPADGWIMATFETDDLARGRMIETGSLWDCTGALVARSRQLGMLLS